MTSKYYVRVTLIKRSQSPIEGTVTELIDIVNFKPETKGLAEIRFNNLTDPKT